MSNQHIALQVRNENFDYTVIIERTPELETMLRRRMDLAATLAEKDSECWGVVFHFSGFDVYEDLDLGEAFDEGDVALLDELPELGNPERTDYGALVIDSDSAYLRFGIKYVPGMEETSMFSLSLFEKKED